MNTEQTPQEPVGGMNRLIKLVSELVYYSQIHTVNGVRPANMQSHESSWKEAQKWLWDNCVAIDEEYYLPASLPQSSTEEEKELWEEVANVLYGFEMGRRFDMNELLSTYKLSKR